MVRPRFVPNPHTWPTSSCTRHERKSHLVTLMTTQEPSVCCVCGSRTKDPGLGARDRASGHRFEVVRCAGCGLQFTSPRPSTAELESYYPPASAPGWVECQAQRWLRWWRARWCARGLTPGRALDVGCGSGGMLIALQRMGWDVVGLERTEASAEPARRLGLEVHTAGLTDSRLREATFDLAIVWHVLEHLPDPVAALHEIRNRLRPAGRLVVAVPNINSWQARLAGPAWHHLNVPRHLYHFDPQSLQLVLNHAGFQVEGVAHVDGAGGCA
jgi:SAM-dependent methyltransferase